MADEYPRSTLSDHERDELVVKIMRIVCAEMPSPRNPLQSATIRDRLIALGVELPDYAIADAFVEVEAWTRFVDAEAWNRLYEDPKPRYLGQAPPPEDPATIEAVRAHGMLAIVDITAPELCSEW